MLVTVKPKKILFLITKSNWGGAQRYVYDLATNLDTSEYEPVVVLGGDGLLKEQLYHAHIRTISLQSLGRDVSIKKDVAFLKELWTVIKQERPAVIHVNSSKAGAVGVLLGRIFGIKNIIFTAHGWAFNEERPWWQKIIIKFIHWFTVLASHQTIAVSKAIVTEMNWPFARRKMRLIYPGRKIGAMYKKDEARAQLTTYNPKLTSSMSKVWIMTIAELHPIKQLDILIKATAHLRDCGKDPVVVIIGEGQLEASLKELTQELSLQEHVYFTGAVPEAARLLKAADLFVLLSKSEAYGYALHEAALAELPVIVTAVGGLVETVFDSKTGKLLASNNPTDLAELIQDFIENPDLWQMYAKNLHASIEERTTASMMLKTEALYRLGGKH